MKDCAELAKSLVQEKTGLKPFFLYTDAYTSDLSEFLWQNEFNCGTSFGLLPKSV